MPALNFSGVCGVSGSGGTISGMKTALLYFLLLLLIFPLHAQETVPETITLGTPLNGRIDDATPRVVYSINGTRGEVVRFRLQATGGDLDPVLVIFTAAGEILFNRDDSNGSRNVETNLTFQDNGQFTVVVGRFGYALGTTTGTYELSVERVGILSTEGTTLQYGIPVTNTITNMQPQIYYTIQANEGDIINIEMVRSSGNLDPTLQVMDRNRELIAENDDADGTTRNSRIEGLVIRETGSYIVVATRYGEAAGNSVGSFVLTVGETDDSGLGNTRQAPMTLTFNETIEDQLTRDQYQRFYQFTGRTNQLVTVTMDRAASAGQLDAYLILANAGFQLMTEDDDSGSGANARIDRYRLPADGIYYIIATRFEGENGTSWGSYRLTLQDEGDAFGTVPPEIPRLLYGTSLQDVITNEDPDSLYAFWGTQGERVIIAMDATGGDLDPVLELLDNNRVRMVRDDDGGANNNARIARYELPYSGVYYIRTMRYDGTAGNPNTTGTYNLTLTLDMSGG